ncbi:MAG TPA: nodulation protein NfeD [Acidobacteriota bacterium]|nr:nodulation protein NfeD [Acidobacteriota bacterium]
MRSRLLTLTLWWTLVPAYADIVKIEIDGIIDPITAEFIAKAVEEAEAGGAEFLLLQLSTPGGLGVSMQEIVQTILNSRVPVVCYVAPRGARAASAGFFILLAADVAVMAPGTNTGAAHPVFPFGAEDKVMLEKVRNDALASLRSIVQHRRRNYELAEKGVVESKSYTEQEALEGGLIDLVAADETELIRLLHGREVRRFDGEVQVLETEGVPLHVLEMTLRQRVLSAIADPNLALILGVIGVLGLYFEFTQPGMVVPGVVGGICLLLALLGFSLLPINLVGVLLILLAIGLFVAEVKVQGFGILGIGGVVSMVLGLLVLVESPYPELRIGLSMALAVAIPFALIFIFLLRLVIVSYRSRVATGNEALVGLVGTARTEIGPDGGRVFVAGELWRASSRQIIPKGARVRVVQARHLDLVVEPYSGDEVDRIEAGG